MEARLLQSLEYLGCTEKECRFYLACFKLGPSSVADIAALAKIRRSTAYLVADQLTEKGLISQDYRTYNKLYTAASPRSLVTLLESKKRRMGRLSLDMQDNIAKLEDLYGTRDSMPAVTSYRGTNGLVPIWKDILAASGEILLWTNQATEPRIFASSQHEQFVKERIKRNLPIRVLAVDNKEGRSLLPHDSDRLRETRILPDRTSFSAETYLYDDKTAILDYQNDLFGLIITSRFINEAQKALFEMAWALSWRRSA